MEFFFSPKGRFTRSQYWLGSIAVFGAILFAGLIFEPYAYGDSDVTLFIILMMLAVYIAIIAAGIIVQVKRLHDHDKSGAWVLINLIPVIGSGFLFIYLGFIEGTKGPNSYDNIEGTDHSLRAYNPDKPAKRETNAERLRRLKESKKP